MILVESLMLVSLILVIFLHIKLYCMVRDNEMSERNSGVGCLIFSIIGWGMPVIAYFNIVFSSISDAPEFEAELDAAFVVVCGGVGAVIHLINMIIAGVLFAEKTGYNKRYLPGLVSSGAYYVFLVIPYFFIAHWSFF